MVDGTAQTAARGRVAARIRALGAHLSEAAFEIEHGRIGELAHEMLDGASVPAEHAYGVVARTWLAEFAQVSVAMGDYLIEHRDEPEGKWLRSQRKLGTVYWSEAGVHETRNVGTTDSHTIRIEIKF